MRQALGILLLAFAAPALAAEAPTADNCWSLTVATENAGHRARRGV
jgi:hypothetical protein